MLVMLVRTSTRFYGMLKDNTVLPLGARELFLPELRTLTDIRDRLMEDPEHAERMLPGVAPALEAALATVEALIERILLSLPDSATRRPIKPFRNSSRHKSCQGSEPPAPWNPTCPPWCGSSGVRQGFPAQSKLR